MSYKFFYSQTREYAKRSKALLRKLNHGERRHPLHYKNGYLLNKKINGTNKQKRQERPPEVKKMR